MAVPSPPQRSPRKSSLRGDMTVQMPPTTLSAEELAQALQLVARTLAATLNTECNKGVPSEPIDIVINANGDMICRCQHDPCHVWRLDGSQA